MAAKEQPYDFQRDDRLDLLESEINMSVELARRSSPQLRMIQRTAQRIIEVRGDGDDDHGDQMLGVALIAVLAFLIGLALAWPLFQTLALVVSL